MTRRYATSPFLLRIGWAVKKGWEGTEEEKERTSKNSFLEIEVLNHSFLCQENVISAQFGKVQSNDNDHCFLKQKNIFVKLIKSL
jgi:hypothetical protein